MFQFLVILLILAMLGRNFYRLWSLYQDARERLANGMPEGCACYTCKLHKLYEVQVKS